MPIFVFYTTMVAAKQTCPFASVHPLFSYCAHCCTFINISCTKPMAEQNLERKQITMIVKGSSRVKHTCSRPLTLLNMTAAVLATYLISSPSARTNLWTEFCLPYVLLLPYTNVPPSPQAWRIHAAKSTAVCTIAHTLQQYCMGAMLPR